MESRQEAFAIARRRPALARPLSILAFALVASLGALPAAADARRPPERVIQDDAVFLFNAKGPEYVARNLDRVQELGFDRVRVTAIWNLLARDAHLRQRPANFDATDPGRYRQEWFHSLDQVVTLAHERGLKVVIDIAFWAPLWAVEDNGMDAVGFGRTYVKVNEFAQFAEAVVTRYSGVYTPPSGQGSPPRYCTPLERLLGCADKPGKPPTGPLPKVSMYTLWNEPNIAGFLKPQWAAVGDTRKPVAPHHYREMVRAAYPVVKQLMPESTVLVGGTAMGGSYDIDTLTGGVPPLRFLREFACVDEGLLPMDTAGCRGFRRVPGDGWAHHPYSFGVRPDQRSGSDNVRMGDLPLLADALRELARRGRIDPRMADIYINEMGYQTWTHRPGGVSLAHQAWYWPWTEYLAWRLPQVKMHSQFLVRDVDCHGRPSCLTWYTGYLTELGEPKPVMEAFRAGLYVKRTRRGGVFAWGRVLPRVVASDLRVEYTDRSGDWHTLLARGPGAGASLHPGGVITVKRTRPLRVRTRRWRLAYHVSGEERHSPSVPLDRGPKPTAKQTEARLRKARTCRTRARRAKRREVRRRRLKACARRLGGRRAAATLR